MDKSVVVVTAQKRECSILLQNMKMSYHQLVISTMFCKYLPAVRPNPVWHDRFSRKSSSRLIPELDLTTATAKEADSCVLG